ncbi:MAG: DUF5011 domain-containing protein [Candidatus Izemoplasmatales bacterium]|nr:DUF5011 domain-containing protein [Candidatus Izemoplasmatales bacterium]
MKKFLMMALFFCLSMVVVACTPTTALDTTKPVISGQANVVYYIGSSATPNYATNVTAVDNFDGTITSKLVINSTAVNLAVPGTYEVVYTVTDLSGNTQTATITVTVVDNTDPVITITSGISYVLADPAPNYTAGVTATDDVDGDITADIVVDSTAVNLLVVGVYTITYTVEDSSGNIATVNNYVQVKQYADDADLLPPVFNGVANITYIIGIDDAIDYTDGVTAIDGVDGDVTADIVVDSSAVNLAVPGTYLVTYTVLDSVGNPATRTIMVTVENETVPPVISGVHTINGTVGSAPNYLLGITATDNVDGNITANIDVDAGLVNLSSAGTYTITYTVTDAAGNTTTATAQVVLVSSNYDVDTPDLTAIYQTYTSGTDNLNPYSEMLNTASELYGYLTDALYTGDYDWAEAEAILIAEGETIVGDMDFDDWYAAGKTADQLPYNRFPAMAASEPVMMDTEGTIWRITLRTDLVFEDGTPINAETFNYSWQQLLDPFLLNQRASNLYDTTSLPLKNAEGYFKQKSPATDGLGYVYYMVEGVKYSRENAYYGTVIGQPTWPLYYVQSGPWDPTHLVGPSGAQAYLEYWGSSSAAYGEDGFVLEDEAGNCFRLTAGGALVAPSAGWLLDGVELPTTGQGSGAASYAGTLPAFMNAAKERCAVDANLLPAGGVVEYLNPEYEWSDVGFKVIDEFTIELTLSKGKTAWDVMGNLTSGITGVVHPANYEAGMNATRTQTTYGNIDNPLVSYGPYRLSVWQTGTLYYFTWNPTYYAKEDYRIRTIRYDVITDQSVAIDEFKAGRLDVVGVGGAYFQEFKNSPNLKLTPSTIFFRFAFNIGGGVSYQINPILIYPEFRQAFYFSIDRSTLCSDVRAPSFPTHGLLGPVYLSTEYNSIPYRGSDAGVSVLADYSPESNGYDPVRAKELFDTAYALAVAADAIEDGDLVTVEYKFYDVETNWQIANWIKSQMETTFNAGEASPIFQLSLAAVSSTALDTDWDNKDFEVTFGGWQGLNFDAPSMLGQVYNSADTETMLESGFDTENAVLTVSLPNSKVALQAWVANYETVYAEYLAWDGETEPAPLVQPSVTAQENYDGWKAMLLKFDGDILTCTYNELFHYAYTELYNVADVNYTGKTDDFDNITGALEGELLRQMINIPLFTTVSATTYSDRIVFEANAYHAWMAWGGLKYMYIASELEE